MKQKKEAKICFVILHRRRKKIIIFILLGDREAKIYKRWCNHYSFTISAIRRNFKNPNDHLK